MKVLFVCSQNHLRSPTAEAVFRNWPGVEARSAGTAIDATKPVTEEMIRWAELIFVMEGLHFRLLKERFGEFMRAKEVIVLRIPDQFAYMDPKLVELLKEKVGPYLESGPAEAAPN